MATWELKNSVLTNKGTEVLAKVQAGIGSLRVTRAVVGSSKVEEGELVNQTSVTNEKGEMQIVGKTGTVNGSIIDLRFDNTGLEESFDLWQIGIYVEHPDFEGEILYHISQATAPDEVPLPSVTPALLSYSLYINHTNVPDITIEINPVGTVPMELFQQHINDTLLHTNFVDAEGDGSSLTVTYDKIKTLEDGQHLSVRVPAALNEGATLSVNGGEAHNIVTTDGNNIKSNVVASGFIIPVVYNSKTSKWNLEGVSTPADLSSIDSSIAEISNKIGKTSDGEEQLTLFGKLAAIIAKLLGIETKVDTANTNIDTIDTKVGTSDDAKTEPTLFGKIAGIGDILSENLTPVTEKITEVLNKVTGSDNKIGTESDADTQPTLFGRLAQLKNVLLEKLAEVLTKVTGIDGKIGTSGDTAEKNTLFGYIVSVHRSMNKKCVISKNKQFDVEFRQIRYSGDATLLMLNRVSDYDGSILIELTNDFSPSGNSKKFLWAFSESSLMVSSSDYSSTLKIKELISLPEGSQLSSKIWNFPIMRASGETPNTLYPVSFYKSNSENFYKQSFCLQVKKGERYFLIGGFESSHSGSTSFSASVYYDVKEV